jgi:hypothetical protein
MAPLQTRDDGATMASLPRLSLLELVRTVAGVPLCVASRLRGLRVCAGFALGKSTRAYAFDGRRAGRVASDCHETDAVIAGANLA